MDRRGAQSAWINFKTIIFHFVDINIPTTTIKSTFTSPWFDSECYEAIREKERTHNERSKNLGNEFKFSEKRRGFKNLSNKNNRENLYNYDDPYLITKNFWSNHRSKNTCHRIPECMQKNNTYRNKSIDKAELFNNYFCDQFSDPSKYDIIDNKEKMKLIFIFIIIIILFIRNIMHLNELHFSLIII